MKRLFLIALGLFLGNWLVVPFFIHRTMRDGFYIGLISGGSALATGLLLGMATSSRKS